MSAEIPLDALPVGDVVELLVAHQQRAVVATRAAVGSIAAAASLLAGAFRDGGRVCFAGAGTSGRLAEAEALELPGTFGLPATRCLALVAERVAGGDRQVNGPAEDDERAGVAAVNAVALTANDVLVAISASGGTPFTAAAAGRAAERGARVIAVVTARGSALARSADAAVEVEVADEVLLGSSRLSAGTAQKIVLNTMTTAAMALLGRVHDQRMVDLVPANHKLRERAVDIVASVAGCDTDRAAEALSTCQFSVRAAIVMLVRSVPQTEALSLVRRHESLRSALSATG